MSVRDGVFGLIAAAMGGQSPTAHYVDAIAALVRHLPDPPKRPARAKARPKLDGTHRRAGRMGRLAVVKGELNTRQCRQGHRMTRYRQRIRITDPETGKERTVGYRALGCRTCARLAA